MKSTGKILTAFVLLFFSAVLSAAEIKTELSDYSIMVGESATLSLKISGGSSEIKPVKFPAVSGLSISYNGSSRSYQYVNGKSWSGIVLSFLITGEKKGEYRIPPFILETGGERISSSEVKLRVTDEPASGRSGGNMPLKGEVELTSDTLYTGEPLILRYYVNSGGNGYPEIGDFIEMPQAGGFVIRKINENIETSGKAHVASFYLVPAASGDYNIGGGALETVIDVKQGFFSMGRRMKIMFPVKTVKVIPIPPAGKAAHFAGDVGDFKIEAEMPDGVFRAYDEIKIPIRVSGNGNILTLSPPKIENEDDIRSLVEEREYSITPEGKKIKGFKNFIITVIPQRSGKVDIGRIFIEYFNSEKKNYLRAETVPVSIQVAEGGTSGISGEVKLSGEKKIFKSSAVIYALIAVLVVSVFVVLLVVWERRKIAIIREEISGNSADDNVGSLEESVENIIDRILKSAEAEDREEFLLNSDRIINRALASGVPVNSELEKIKERVYFYRYGGGNISADEMLDIARWLRKNLK